MSFSISRICSATGIKRIINKIIVTKNLAASQIDEFVVNADKMSKEKDLSTIVERYISHIVEPRYKQYKIFPTGTKIQTPSGIKTVKAGEVVIMEQGLNGKPVLTIEKAEDVIHQRGKTVYSQDGKVEQLIENSKKTELSQVEKKLKEKGVEFIGVKDSEEYFLDENLLVKINGKLYELNPNGVGYPKNDNGLSVKKMLLNTIEKFGHLKPQEINHEEFFNNANPYFLEAFLKAQK